MLKETLVQVLLSLPPVKDGTPLHAPIPIKPVIADVIATISLDVADGYPGIDPALFASRLYVIGAHESAFKQHLYGDCPGLKPGDLTCSKEKGARSCGVWQTPCAETPMPKPGERDNDVLGLKQARVAAKILLQSMKICPRNPIAAYAVGNGFCGTLPTPELYFREAQERLVFFPDA